ncbi:hypothetical protein ZWY2020_012508 [Hordeum vulgare]|nr:hypothetical protein ZWY2020_012508 [Hordeum vulgare]
MRLHAGWETCRESPDGSWAWRRRWRTRIHIDGRHGLRGQWGDDRYNAYGAGPHRGSSSSGGGRGEFNGPLGQFVEGATGPVQRNWAPFRYFHGSRGGGKKPHDHPRDVEHPPKPSETTAARTPEITPAEGAGLSGAALEAVRALAGVNVPATSGNAFRGQVDCTEGESVAPFIPTGCVAQLTIPTGGAARLTITYGESGGRLVQHGGATAGGYRSSGWRRGRPSTAPGRQRATPRPTSSAPSGESAAPLPSITCTDRVPGSAWWHRVSSASTASGGRRHLQSGRRQHPCRFKVLQVSALKLLFSKYSCVSYFGYFVFLC